jgi:hypothetical protein
MKKYVAELRQDFSAIGKSLAAYSDEQIIAWLEKNREWYVKLYQEKQNAGNDGQRVPTESRAAG